MLDDGKEKKNKVSAFWKKNNKRKKKKNENKPNDQSLYNATSFLNNPPPFEISLFHWF